MSGQSTEVIRCPNCKEDVPKTLYCLNCGYPLYKLEQKKSDETVEKIEFETEGKVDMSVEIPPQEQELAEKEMAEEEEQNLEIETPILVEEKPQEQELEEKEMAEEEQKHLEEEVENEEIFEEPSEGQNELELKKDIFPSEESESYMINEMRIEFAPDPLTKEIMESLAKNITLKVRLVRLLRESQVKEETFKKLFDSYVDQGKLWVERRDEIIKRFKADIERMEQELISARKDYELLEIRKNIGDASDEEYNVKAPSYKWDIENLEKDIKNSRGGIQYVFNLKGLIPEEEVAELQQMSDSDYNELDDIDGISGETITRMKETLMQALNILEF